MASQRDIEGLVAHRAVVAPGGAPPARWVLFLHGIFGSGGNWRSFAQRLVGDERNARAARPWGAALVDLRHHGASALRAGFAPPHTVVSAARDLLALDEALGAPVEGLVGHSFGAKVGLAYAQLRGAARPVARAVFVDGMPGARPDARGSELTLRVLGLLEALAPRPFATRELFVQELRREGIADELARWLAMNLHPLGDEAGAGFALRADLAAVRAMLDDYFARDLWSVLEAPPPGVRWHVVVGGRSQVFAADDRARLARCAEASAAQGASLAAHTIERAGHWVHVDAPAETEAVLREAFFDDAPA